jgi:hypothetical protein
MHVNAKMKPVESTPGIWGGWLKDNVMKAVEFIEIQREHILLPSVSKCLSPLEKELRNERK